MVKITDHKIMEPTENNSNKKQDAELPALTSIREMYTLSTPTADEVMKKNFIETLAEVSLAIAIRRVNQPGKWKEKCGP